MTLTDVIAIAACIISVYSLFKNRVLSMRINAINLESHLYMKIFDDYLLTKLPESRNQLYIDGNKKLREYEDLAKLLVEIKKSALYFDYRNKLYYRKLKNTLEDFEELLINTEGKIFEGSDGTDILSKIDFHMRELYSCIISDYIEKK